MAFFADDDRVDISEKKEFPNVVIISTKNAEDKLLFNAKLVNYIIGSDQPRSDHIRFIQERIVEKQLQVHNRVTTTVKIFGQASRKGDDRKFDNMALSRRRAQNVIRLIRAGITAMGQDIRFEFDETDLGTEPDKNERSDNNNDNSRAVEIRITGDPRVRDSEPVAEKVTRPITTLFATHLGAHNLGPSSIIIFRISERNSRDGVLYVYGGFGFDLDPSAILKAFKVAKEVADAFKTGKAAAKIGTQVLEIGAATPQPFLSNKPRGSGDFNNIKAVFIKSLAKVGAGSIGAMFLTIEDCTSIRLDPLTKLEATFIAASAGLVLKVPSLVFVPPDPFNPPLGL